MKRFNISKKFIFVIMIFVLLVNYFLPLKEVFASGAYTISFRLDGNAVEAYTFANDNNALSINGVYIVPREATNYTLDVVGTTATFTITDGTPTTLSFNAGNAFRLYANNNEVTNETNFSTNTDVFVADYSGGQIVYPSGDYGDIEFDIEFTNTYCNVWMNGNVIISDQNGQFNSTFNDVVNRIGITDDTDYNILRFQNSFGELPVTEFIINGDSYTEGMNTVLVNDEGWYIAVPGNTRYVIRGAGDTNFIPTRTIIWANAHANQNAQNYADDMLLNHGSARVMAIYDEHDNLVSNEVDVDDDGLGFVAVYPGYKVVFEFVPEYGYQLTGVSANGFPLEPQGTINQYKFTMPDTNIHFSAEFTRIDAVVEANSDKLAAASIDLGDNFDSGSAQLTINDVNLSEDKIDEFTEIAGDYNISSYIDINLYNIFYKGKADADDVWTYQVNDLSDFATITLKLAEGIDASDIVIVHNIHDGDEYEVIEIESYDPKTNTITFKTKGFSNYAIAYKEKPATPAAVVPEIINNIVDAITGNDSAKSATVVKSNNPDTLDRISLYIILFLICGGIYTFANSLVRKRLRNN